MIIPPLYENQEHSSLFFLDNERVYDMSDPGTGKTRSCLESIKKRKHAKTLVLAPKSILYPSWACDIKQFTPELTYVIADANNRQRAFDMDVNIYITNHDAVSWLRDNRKHLKKFDTLIIDEITAFKHRTSQRSKALNSFKHYFNYRIGLSGTPNPNTVLDLWHQFYLLDDGKRLGTIFHEFRSIVCKPGFNKWVDKDGAEQAISSYINDIVIRNKLEDCIDIPKNRVITIPFQLSTKHLTAYKTLHRHSLLVLDNEAQISAIHAVLLTTKLLQLASGAVYDENHVQQLIASERYELVMELAGQREHCLIAFNWTHQRDELIKHAKKNNYTFAIIDGSISSKDRNKAVDDFQTGKLKLLLAHPMSASHGLTLTKGTTTIWVSPTYDAERFKQFNRRIYRSGQTQETETLLICAEDTLESRVYSKLDAKLDRMQLLLDLAVVAQTSPDNSAIEFRGNLTING